MDESNVAEKSKDAAVIETESQRPKEVSPASKKLSSSEMSQLLSTLRKKCQKLADKGPCGIVVSKNALI